MTKKTIIILSLSILSFLSYSQPSEDLSLFFKLSEYYLKRHVYNGLVNYHYTKQDLKEISFLKTKIGDVDLSNADTEERKAFYINAYNLSVIYKIAMLYPIAGPLDSEGFFDETKVKVAGEELTLNELEKKKIFNQFNDERFHFVLSCAAMSCPKLYNHVYTGENVEELIKSRTKMVLNDKEFIRVNDKRREVQISQIFKWYEADFEKVSDSMIDYINKYRDKAIPVDYKVKYYEYDWSLNERKVN